MAWSHVQQLIRDGKTEFYYGRTVVNGLESIEALVPGMGMPLGFIWYRWGNGSELEIAYIWTHEDVRRAGLATQMFDKLLGAYSEVVKVVSTGQVNEMSKPWCIKNGFKYDKVRNYWLREMPQPRKRTTKAK